MLSAGPLADAFRSWTFLLSVAASYERPPAMSRVSSFHRRPRWDGLFRDRRPPFPPTGSFPFFKVPGTRIQYTCLATLSRPFSRRTSPWAHGSVTSALGVCRYRDRRSTGKWISTEAVQRGLTRAAKVIILWDLSHPPLGGGPGCGRAWCHSTPPGAGPRGLRPGGRLRQKPPAQRARSDGRLFLWAHRRSA